MTSDTGSEYIEEEVRADELNPNIDENALAAAARQARLPFDRPTSHELTFFPELWEHKTAVEVFLLIRNTTLATWQNNPIKECTAQDVRHNVYPPFNSDLDLIQNIVHYLTRYGLINFGRYTRSTKINRFLVRDERKVIVIGAGASGIAAATQLVSFGFDVIILEARPKVGGRIGGFRTKRGQLMEPGADTLRQFETSPIATLLQQINLEEHGVFDYTTVLVDGKPLSDAKLKIILGHYHTARGALDYQANNGEHRDEDNLYISRQQAYENLVNMVERTTLVKYYNYTQALEAAARSREFHFNRLKELRKIARLAENKLKQMEETDDLEDDPLLRRSLKRDIATAIAKFDEHSDAFEAAENQWVQLMEHPVPKQYMHPGTDFATYNFMLGFEEYLIGAELERVQFTNAAIQNKENGVATRLNEGLLELFEQIAQKRNLDIRLKHRVKNIDYSGKDRVKLTVLKGTGEIEEMTAAFVVCTLPIGVLKKTVENDERAPVFNPPLPEKKVTAIRSIGCGLINKCILEFDKAFWAHSNRYQFVTVQPNLKTRGSLSIWSSVPNSKVLTTYIVGQEAQHTIPNDVVVQNAIQSLQKVFGNNCPKVPVSAHVTRWQNDEFAFGSGSYMNRQTELKHFDDLMEALQTEDGVNRLYFAGEHTCASFTSTVQGAWMSGVRAATDMANHHNGIGFVDMSGAKKDAPDEDDEIITIDRDGQMPADQIEDKEIQVIHETRNAPTDEPGPSSSA